MTTFNWRSSFAGRSLHDRSWNVSCYEGLSSLTTEMGNTMKTSLWIALTGLSGTLTLGGMSVAQSANPVDAVVDCLGITDDVARLTCYDTAATQLRGDVETGEIMAVTRAQVEEVEDRGFGLPVIPMSSLFERRSSQHEEISESAIASSEVTAGEIDAGPLENNEIRVVERDGDNDPEQILMLVEDVQRRAGGKWRIVMANGQVWDTISSENLIIPYVRNGEQLFAEISTASFGSYLLQLNGRGTSYRVRRQD